MKGVDMIGGTGRSLLSTALLCGVIATAAIAVMVAVASGSVLLGLVVGAPALAVGMLVIAPRARWRMTIDRRRLRRRVVDPRALAGDWRRLLTAAWVARDEFAGIVAGYGSSPIGERLAAQQQLMDQALERCGTLAQCGHRLLGQLRAFRTTRLRRDLLRERHRDRHGVRALALARQLQDVGRLRDELDHVRVQLEEQVHDMRTAAWRASVLRSRVTEDADVALTELLDELAHLRAALSEVERPSQHAAAAS